MGQLSAGDPAPPFEALDHDGSKVGLQDLKGKRTVLYFFPKADTSG